MEDKLKPCPSCGTQPQRTIKGQILSVECPNCGFCNQIRLGCLADSQRNERAENQDRQKAKYNKTVKSSP